MKQLDAIRLGRAAEGMNKAHAKLADAQVTLEMAEADVKAAAQGVADAQAEFEMASQPVEKVDAPKAPPAAGVITEKSRA